MAVTITCDAGANTAYIRHCWYTTTVCDPGNANASTCSVKPDGSCVVNTNENDPNDAQWFLASKCKNTTNITWSTTNSTGPYNVDDEKPLVYYNLPFLFTHNY